VPIAASLSFLLPGLGELYIGRRLAAAAFAVPSLLVAGCVLLQLTGGIVPFAAAMLDSTFALTIAILAIAAALLRIGSIAHASALALAGGRPSRRAVGIVAVLVLVVVSSHGLVASYAWSLFIFDQKISSNNFVYTPDASAEPSASGAVYIPVESAMPPSSVTGRVTILLTGVDFGPGRSHALNDAIMLLSLDADSKQVAILSIPRDTAGFPLYWGGTASPKLKINALVTYVRNGWVNSPDPPMTTLVKEVGWLVGIPVNYYAAIDLAGFSQMIDALGGVDVVNPKAINDPSEHINVPAGPLHLDGETALKYVRSRHGAGGSDYARSSRQQDVLVAAVRKATSPSMVLQLPSLLEIGGKTIQTNFPLNQARDYVAIAQAVPADGISKCVLGPPYSWYPDPSTTEGLSTSQLLLDRVAALSVQLFGTESRYYGKAGIVPAPCGG